MSTDDRLYSQRGREALMDAMRRGRTVPMAPDATFTYVQPARLQAMSLPNGKFLLVLDRWGGSEHDLAAAQRALGEGVPDAYVLVSDRTVEVQSWPDADLATSAAEACALTHGEEDEALIAQVRGVFASQAADAESWRSTGAAAVDELDTMRAARDRAEDEVSRWRYLARELAQVGPVLEADEVDDIERADAELRAALTQRFARLEGVVADVREAQAAAPRTRVRDLRLGSV